MIKCIELFAGIGGWKRALDNLGINNICIPYEIDKDTIAVYNIINNDIMEPCDVSLSNIEFAMNIDIIFMSPPFQDFSPAKQTSKKDTKRSNLINDTFNIIYNTKPRYIFVENVPSLKKSEQYENWKKDILILGYYNKEAILNSLDYNWPQNRKRFFSIFFKNENDYLNYEWPEKENFTFTLNKIINNEFSLYENYTFKSLPQNAKLRKNENGYVWGNYIDNSCYLLNKYIGTITATFNQPWLLCGFNNDKIRKLTVKECFLLMGYTENDYNNIKYTYPKLSNSKLKKMAGNSLVIPLIEKILKNLDLRN